MKKPYLPSVLLLLFAVSSFTASGQTRSATIGALPGVSQGQMLMLREMKTALPIVTPTWLPAGFKLENIRVLYGSEIEIYDQELVLVYSRTMSNGKVQRFALEAGFDGLGDLPYEDTKVIKSSLGDIYLVYEPNDPDNSKSKLNNFVMTQWFSVGDIAYHYVGMYGEEKNLEMISLADTEKILASLRKF